MIFSACAGCCLTHSIIYLTCFQIFRFFFFTSSFWIMLDLGGYFFGIHFSQDHSIKRGGSPFSMGCGLSCFTSDNILAHVATSDLWRSSQKSHTHLFGFPFVKQKVIPPHKNQFLCMIHDDLGSHLGVYKNIESGLSPISLWVGKLKFSK